MKPPISEESTVARGVPLLLAHFRKAAWLTLLGCTVMGVMFLLLRMEIIGLVETRIILRAALLVFVIAGTIMVVGMLKAYRRRGS